MYILVSVIFLYLAVMPVFDWQLKIAQLVLQKACRMTVIDCYFNSVLLSCQRLYLPPSRPDFPSCYLLNCSLYIHIFKISAFSFSFKAFQRLITRNFFSHQIQNFSWWTLKPFITPKIASEHNSLQQNFLLAKFCSNSRSPVVQRIQQGRHIQTNIRSTLLYRFSIDIKSFFQFNRLSQL